MKRPLAVSAIALIWGIILADVNKYQIWGIISLVLSLLIFILVYRPLRENVSVFVLLVIPFLISGYVLHSINKNYYDYSCIEWEGKRVSVKGALHNEPEYIDGKVRFILNVDEIDNSIIKKNIKIQVSIYSDDSITGLEYGSVVNIAGEIKIPPGRRNFGGFNTRKFLASRGVSGTMSIPEKELTICDGNRASWLKKTGYKLRHNIINTLDNCISANESSVLAGMLIGYTAEMPEEMEEDFRRAGLSHVMAVSGANIAFLLAPLLWLLKKVGFNPRWSSVLAFPAMLFYVFATGMEASVVRAAIMAGVILTGMLLWRKADIYCSLAVSAIIILLNNSFMLFDLGFILSFAATMSLVIFYKPVFCRLPVKIPKIIRDTLAGTVAAQLGVIPVIAYSFNTLSIISVLTNLLIVPLTGIITVLGAVLIILGNIFLPAAKIPGILLSFVINLMMFITEAMAAIPWAEINIATPSIFLVLIYYFVLLYFRYGHPKLEKEVAKPVLAAITAFCGAVILFISIPSNSLQIYFADVGQGDCAIIRTPSGKNIIIDGGGSINDQNGSYAGERIVVPLLYNLNMTGIDLMIASHGHMDHIGGLITVIDKINVKKLIVADTNDIEMKYLTDHASNKGVPVIRMKEDDILYEEDGLALKVLYPFMNDTLMPNASTTNANELSLVVRLDYGDFSALFTGDIGSVTEQRILNNKNEIRCDLLKVAHHGSKYSSNKSFIEAINPDMSVISAGRNTYGHPSPETVERIAGNGSDIFQTIINGGILVEVWEKENRMRVTTVVQ
ncbi:MAG: DNA internalization-related competence protein ComEC/Rec2 [Clostridiaceae bacterium]|jgi:competence protein ComEC|nr:DNA internalization-related competence protein ComEC/Rec2 [Clostridiaceae bacterium]